MDKETLYRAAEEAYRKAYEEWEASLTRQEKIAYHAAMIRGRVEANPGSPGPWASSLLGRTCVIDGKDEWIDPRKDYGPVPRFAFDWKACYARLEDHAAQ